MLMSFCEILRNTTHVGHIQSMCHRQKKQVSRQRNNDLEETDVQEVLLAYKESRELRGEQRVNRGYRPVTGRTSGGKPYRVKGRLNIKELISRTRCRICRERGHCERECSNKVEQVPRDGEEAKT